MRRNETQKIISLRHFTVRHSALSRCHFQEHSHSAFTVTAVLSGRFEVTIGGESFRLSAGEAALTAIGQVHSGGAEDAEFTSVSITPRLVDELARESGLIGFGNQISFRRATTDDPELMAAIGRITEEAISRRLGHGAMLDALVRQLVIILFRSHLMVRRSALIELSRAGPVDRRLRRAMEFMHDNYWRELSLEEIASAAYLSEYHFARLFKQITGITPHFYLANLRLERARELLSNSEIPIGQVAAMVGYQSQSHFTKIFKSVTGLTPKAYRDCSARFDSAIRR
jgi:AraC family transcriptional regulator